MLHARHKTTRRGLTLVELLVAISILAVLAAISIPVVQPLLKGRRVREALRALDVYLGSARIKAMQTGKPVGVLFERSENNNHASVVLRQVAVPPPYAGDMDGALIQLEPYTFGAGEPEPPVGEVWYFYRFTSADSAFEPGTNPPRRQEYLAAAALWYPSVVNGRDGLVQPGDQIQLNYQGPLYNIGFPQGAVGLFIIRLTSHNRGGPPHTPAALAAGLPFQVFRQPKPTAAKPLHLSRGTAVDLGDSGSHTSHTWFAPSSASDMSNVMIVFAPNGSVQYVYRGNGRSRITQPLFLMVGLSTRAGGTIAEDDGLENWQDLSNFWLTIQPQTGLASGAEVHTSGTAPPVRGYDVPTNIHDSRGYARQAQVTTGGR